jgi:hypothetical protein
MSCAACRNAKGYSTPCPYCRAPGDMQRKAAEAKAAEVAELGRIGAALEQRAARATGPEPVRLHEVRAQTDTEGQLANFDSARKMIAEGKARGFAIIIQEHDGSWSQWRYHDRRYELVGVLHSVMQNILEEE